MKLPEIDIEARIDIDGIKQIQVLGDDERVTIIQGASAITIPANGGSIQGLINALLDVDSAIGRYRTSRPRYEAPNVPEKKDSCSDCNGS